MSIEAATVLGVAFGGVTWLLGLSFWAGRIAERVNHGEASRMEIKQDIKQIFEKIDNLWGRKFDRGRDDS